MDLNIIRDVGQVEVPPVEARAVTGNSISMTSAGDFFLLDQRGVVHFTNIRPSTPSENDTVGMRKGVQTLPLPADVDLSSLRHICTNSDATLVCLWSETKAIVLEIPDEWTREGALKIVHKKDNSSSQKQQHEAAVKVQVIYDLKAETEPRKIAKVSFHPANEHSIVLLFESDKLIVYDVRSELPQTFYLPREHNYTAFTFGPNLEWLRFTIFLTTTTNQLYALCPIIPFGTLVSYVVVEELWSWFEEMEYKLSTSGSKQDSNANNKYIELMRNYLLGMVGNKDALAKDSYVVAGEAVDLSTTYKFSGEVDTNSSYASIHAIFDRHRLQLQGPLALNTTSPSSSTHTICDITIPSVKYSDIAPPVIVAAYTSGKVDVLLLDAKDTSTWFIAPNWTSASHTGQPCPSLVVADAFSVADKTSGNNKKSSWRIMPDPVFAHNFYLYDATEGEVYLISSGWLHSSLRSIAQALMTLSNGDIEGKSSEVADLVLDRTPSESQCLPIYAPKSKPNAAGLSGVFVVQDPFIGHVAFIRLGSKELVAINITMHTKLCQLQMSMMQDQDGEPDANLHQEFDRIMRSDNIIWQHAHELLTQIAKGLKVLPTLEVTVNSEADGVGGQSEAQNKKFLLETVQLLEKNVILPMKELKECTAFHLTVVEQMYKVQQELIEGRSTESKFGVEKRPQHHTSGSVAVDLSAGLRVLIKSLMDENKALVDRLEKIEAHYQMLKDQAECMLSIIYTHYPKKISDAEVLYAEQLESWNNEVITLTKEIEVVRKLAKKPAPKVHQVVDPKEIKKNQIYAFSSPSGGANKAPSTPFTPSFARPSYINNTPATGSFASPLKGLQSPLSKLDSSSPANPLNNISWSTSKIYQNNTPSKIGLHTSYQQSPILSTTKKSANFVNTPKTETESNSAPLVLTEAEEKACQDLLKKQTELLVDAKRKVEELEKKLSTMKLEADATSELK